MKVCDKKKSIEDDFTSWVLEDSFREKKYGHALDLIESAYRKNKAIELTRIYLNEAIFMGSEIMYWSFKMNRAIDKLPAGGKERDVAIKAIKKEAIDFYNTMTLQLTKNYLDQC